MKTYAVKTESGKVRSVAEEVSERHGGGGSALPVVDERPKDLAQRKLQDMAGNSPNVRKLQGLQEPAMNYCRSTGVVQCIGPAGLNAIFDRHEIPKPDRLKIYDAIEAAYKKKMADITDEEAESYIKAHVAKGVGDWEKQFNDKTCWLAAIAAASGIKLGDLKKKLETDLQWKDEDFFGVTEREIPEICKMLKIPCTKIKVEKEEFDRLLQIGGTVTILVPEHVMVVVGSGNSSGETKYSVWDPADASMQNISWETLAKPVIGAFMIHKE